VVREHRGIAELLRTDEPAIERVARELVAAARRSEDALRMTLRILETNAGARAAMNSPVNTEHAEVLTAFENFLGKLQKVLVWAQADGTVRADITAQDLGMILCGISSAIDSRSYSGWERHLALLIDGVRLPAAHMPLPPARE
jgi:hypothetical protein